MQRCAVSSGPARVRIPAGRLLNFFARVLLHAHTPPKALLVHNSIRSGSITPKSAGKPDHSAWWHDDLYLVPRTTTRTRAVPIIHGAVSSLFSSSVGLRIVKKVTETVQQLADALRRQHHLEIVLEYENLTPAVPRYIQAAARGPGGWHGGGSGRAERRRAMVPGSKVRGATPGGLRRQQPETSSGEASPGLHWSAGSLEGPARGGSGPIPSTSSSTRGGPPSTCRRHGTT